MTNFTKDIAFPQVALFSVLIIIIIYMLSKNALTTTIIGLSVFVLGMNGYLEEIGIGQKSMGLKCRDYLVETGQCNLAEPDTPSLRLSVSEPSELLKKITPITAV